MGARNVDEETIRRWIAEAIAANPGGGTSYLVAEKILTDDEIKALPTTAITIIPSVAGKQIYILGGVLVFDIAVVYNNISYLIETGTGITAGFFTAGNGMATVASEAMGDILGGVGSGVYRLEPNIRIFSSTDSDVIATAVLPFRAQSISGTVTSLTFQVDNYTADYQTDLGNFTEGNAANTIKFLIYYILIDL